MVALSSSALRVPFDSQIPHQSRLLYRKSLPLARSFLLGLITGLVYFLGTLYWITHVMVTYGGLKLWVALLVNGALVAYLALFPALFAVAMRQLVTTYGDPALLTAPVVWVATELGRANLFTGFPWVLLGYSQVTVLPIAQLGSVSGVYGVSALVVAVSAALATTVTMPSAPGRTFGRYVPAALVLAGLVVIAAWGSLRVGRADLARAGQPVHIGIVQGNVEQGQKWDAARAAGIFGDYLRLTRQAIGEGSELILWPESSTPFNFEDDVDGADRVRMLARQARVPILVGSDQIERGRSTRYYNAAFLVRADGSTGAVYRKIHLVPFGEYVPLKRIFFFAAPLVEAVSDYSAGEDAVLLPVDGHLISTAICYEIVYPELVRRFVQGGSELLTTITNDAWFGRTSAPYQHFAQASMRAIENGRYLVRSANTGISGIVDPYGRVLERSDIFQQAVIVGQARFLRGFTFYARHGDFFAYGCALAAVGMLVTTWRRVQ